MNFIFNRQEKQVDGYEECLDYLGFEEIVILQFNYNGKGDALILEDGDIGYMTDKDLRHLFYSGWYKLNKTTLLINSQTVLADSEKNKSNTSENEN